ncbi:hypothetical protein RN001_002941 [Aquatica leii]|uniref:Peptidase M14 domain-containing protein n=1 Tax=Aquatica leii TaxID=1421715 RepID=A0AAN7QBC0_9COLE|nr:hypothetical protein RN001_002941 [Aquatica leii]
MTKEEKLYNEGMKPLMYSSLEAYFNRIGWQRCGNNIKYFSNEGTEDIDRERTYTLTFTIEFPYNEDEVYLAYNYPYTYSDLQDYLINLRKNTFVSTFTSVRLLCKSLAGNNVYCITVHNKSKSTKKAVVIMARIHPVETPSSWMMKGFIDFLTGDSITAKRLRDMFIFQLIPMLNPDGVIVGNSCCSLSGKDLSSEFNSAFYTRYPSIWYAKLLIERMIKRHGVVMFCDLRAQHLMHNIFLYGCDSSRGINKSCEAHFFTTLLYRNASDKFSLASCRYNNQQYYGCTSRVVMWLMGIPNSFTIKVSYGGSRLGSRSGTHFNVQDYENMAHTFCSTLLDFYCQDIKQPLLKNVENALVQPIKRPHTEGSDKHLTQYSEDEKKLDYLKFLKMDCSTLFPLMLLKSIADQKIQWPTECQVIYPKVTHIYFVPRKPEPYYIITGKEAQPKPIGEKRGKIVYEYRISAMRNYTGSISDRDFFSHTPVISNNEYTLKFESRFESGNLAKAIKINDLYYELYVRNDLYSMRQKQWFYFRVTNMKKDVTYRLSIVNMTKKENLYSQGMKPLLYSTKDASLNKIGWRRCGDNINYFCNEGIHIEESITYTLTFTLEFPYEGDTVYLAYCYPYTYSDLKAYLCELCNHPIRSTYATIRQLCKTIAGNDLYYVTITSPRIRRKLKNNKQNAKKAIIVTARVHPAETPSSWMMKGFLDFLTDGVIIGNTRYSLSGRDLNGQFKYGSRKSYPTVWYTKLLIRRTIEKRGVALYCDLHSQYSIHNIFIYGCDKRKGRDKNCDAHIFPTLLEKHASDKFSLESCKYNDEKIKEGTARMEVWMMGVPNCYTVEASFAGSKLNDRFDTHFNVQDYENLVRAFNTSRTLILFYFDDFIIFHILQHFSNAIKVLELL